VYATATAKSSKVVAIDSATATPASSGTAERPTCVKSPGGARDAATLRGTLKGIAAPAAYVANEYLLRDGATAEAS
jgi:hypothetical protein